MPELPSGTVTLLFTDIEGSTRLLHELGERYVDVLTEHHRVLREVFSRHGGVEVDTQGDAFFVAFARASDAVAAAGEAQDALANGPVRVRIGVHTGEPIMTEEGYVGTDVHRAARIMGAGHGGQVLLSETTRRLLDTTAELRELGDYRLKDLGAPQRLYQLGDGDFPPLRTLYQTNLPIQPTALVGRERELQEAGALVRSHRLLTLTGPGGSGKTRLALQLAAEAVEQFPDGVFWVPLQALRDPALVERAIGALVGADNGLIQHVANKRLLVLLDNFEQVVEAAPVISSLLAGTPNAKVLVTSREPLHVESEQRFPVEPLPDDDAVVLFVERARAVAPGFQPPAAVGEICRRLDRLPLAIELAAARVALLDPDELLARLDRRLPLLASGSRDAPARQRTLRATIEWSYDLLKPEEQELFRRIAVFQGSFSLGAAEAVCGADLDALESLVVKNLLRRWGSGRLGMLDTIREYALERLDESPEVDDIRRRHAGFFLAVADSANLSAEKLAGGGQRHDVAIAEQDNIRGALTWALASGSVALGVELATLLEQFWVMNDPREGMRWFGALLERPEAETVAPDLRAHALRAYGGSTHIAGHYAAAERLWQQSLALFEQLEDEHGRAVLLHRLGISALMRGDLEPARKLVEASHEIHQRNDDWGAKTWGLTQTTGTLGAIARDTGDEQRAYELIAQSAALAGEVGVDWWKGGALAELACLSLNAGQVEEAEPLARESLVVADEMRDRAGRVFGVGLLARLAAERGYLERAGRLWAAIQDEDAVAPLGGWRRHRQTCEARIREGAGPEFERGYAEGRAMTLDDAVSLALAAPDVEARTASPTPGHPGSS
ncbi:MAG: adenylate/guanylate cyclase domain-containing protein [Actinomycetota bacterium]|nr:adenylate/guanylate cyclase domain-containing protein [Actinomycetota bacterium]